MTKEFEILNKKIDLLEAMVSNSLEVIARGSGEYEQESLFNINSAFYELWGKLEEEKDDNN